MSEKQLRFPTTEELPGLRALWAECFPEDAEDGFCDFFLARRFRPDRCLIISEKGRLQSMVHLLTAQLLQTGHEQGSFLYIYAAGTGAEYRGQGNLGLLLQGSLALAEKRGMAGILLTSAIGLEPLYEHYGMMPCAVRHEAVVSPGAGQPIAWEVCEYAEYAGLRKAYLSGLPSAFSWAPETDRFIYDQLRESESIVRWQEEGIAYYAAIGCEDGIPAVLETNHPLDACFLADAAAALDTAELKVCSALPFPGSHPEGFGHWLLCKQVSSDISSYLNLIAD